MIMLKCRHYSTSRFSTRRVNDSRVVVELQDRTNVDHDETRELTILELSQLEHSQHRSYIERDNGNMLLLIDDTSVA